MEEQNVSGVKGHTEVEIQEVEEFDYSGFQVVRREFFAHIFEPAISFKYDSISFNSACVRRMPETEYVQILIHPEQKRLVLKPCDVDAKDAVKWSVSKQKKGKEVISPRTIKCKIFAAKVFDMLSWNINCRYKMLGVIVKTKDEMLFAFNLEDTEVYVPIENNEDGTPKKIGRKPYYPTAWKDSFGLPVEDHNDHLSINVLDGFARFEVVQKKVEPAVSSESVSIDANETSADLPFTPLVDN